MNERIETVIIGAGQAGLSPATARPAGTSPS
jgi:cation diffusion facilitator CzcD-associated flavoprotein CzcO